MDSYEVEINASAERVWQALRDPADLKRWHGWHFDGLDEEIDVIYLKDATEALGKLILGSGDTFTLTDANGRTILRMTRAPRGSNPEWDAYYDDINEGWISFMQQLRFALERHPGEDRQTVYLNQSAAIELPTAAIGDRYELLAPTGELLQGEVWFRSEHQVGLTVDSWGDGLLIATVNGMRILTVYDNAVFPAIEKSWQA